MRLRWWVRPIMELSLSLIVVFPSQYRHCREKNIVERHHFRRLGALSLNTLFDYRPARRGSASFFNYARRRGAAAELCLYLYTVCRSVAIVMLMAHLPHSATLCWLKTPDAILSPRPPGHADTKLLAGDNFIRAPLHSAIQPSRVWSTIMRLSGLDLGNAPLKCKCWIMRQPPPEYNFFSLVISLRIKGEIATLLQPWDDEARGLCIGFHTTVKYWNRGLTDQYN